MANGQPLRFVQLSPKQFRPGFVVWSGAANVRPIIEEIMRAGFTSHNAIAAKLNERNVRTARGGRWTHVQVGAILHPFVASAGA